MREAKRSVAQRNGGGVSYLLGHERVLPSESKKPHHHISLAGDLTVLLARAVPLPDKRGGAERYVLPFMEANT